MSRYLKIFIFALLIVFLPFSESNAAKPPVAIPLSVAAKGAASVVLVKIGSAQLQDGAEQVKYQIEPVRTIIGTSLSTKCLYGPMGLKVGGTYLVFLRKYSDDSPHLDNICGPLIVMGSSEPTAFEIERYPDGKEMVRLDNRRIIPPRFTNSIQVKQSLSDDNGIAETIIGTVVPIDTFVEFLIPG